MGGPDWFDQFFQIEVGREVAFDCLQRNALVQIRRAWRIGLVCERALPPLNGQQWLPFVSDQEWGGCDGCPIREPSRAFLRNGAQAPTETEQWLDEMERSAKRSPTMTVWDDGSGDGGG